MKDKICTVCGVTIKNAYGNERYCPTCREVVKIETSRKWRKSQRQESQTFKCAVCGKELPKTSSNNKYCPDCKAEATKEKQAIYKRSLCGGWCSAPTKPIKAKIAISAKAMPGEYHGQAFYPLVAVAQPKTALTYNQIKQLADKNGVSWQKQAKVLGI